jgi:hypothetical protein
LLLTFSHRYAKSHGKVIVAKLAIKNLSASAFGTVEQPDPASALKPA